MRSGKVRRKSVRRKSSRRGMSKKRKRVSKKSKTRRTRRSTVKKGRKRTRRRRMRGGMLGALAKEKAEARRILKGYGFPTGEFQGKYEDALIPISRNWDALTKTKATSLEALRGLSKKELDEAFHFRLRETEVNKLLDALHYSYLAKKGFDFGGVAFNGLEYLLPEFSRNIEKLKSKGFTNLDSLKILTVDHLENYLGLSRQDAVKFLEALGKYYEDVEVAESERAMRIPVFEKADREYKQWVKRGDRGGVVIPKLPPPNPYHLDVATLMQMARDREDMEKTKTELEAHKQQMKAAREERTKMERTLERIRTLPRGDPVKNESEAERHFRLGLPVDGAPRAMSEQDRDDIRNIFAEREAKAQASDSPDVAAEPAGRGAVDAGEI